MASCVVEMFGLDMAASYQQAFSAIRQLAVLLRGALAMRSKDAFREVYCWQTLNCLELWAKLLAAHADKQVGPGFMHACMLQCVLTSRLARAECVLTFWHCMLMYKVSKPWR